MKHIPKISNDSFIKEILAQKHFINLQLANGIYNIEEHSASTVEDLVKGVIRNSEKPKLLKASKGITNVQDIMYIQHVAGLYWNYDKQISWLEMALKMAKNDVDRKKIKDILKEAVYNHDSAFENHPAISDITFGPVTGKDIRLKEEFYKFNKSRSFEQLQIQNKVKTVLDSYDNNFENILVQLNKTWSNSDLMSVMLAWYRYVMIAIVLK